MQTVRKNVLKADNNTNMQRLKQKNRHAHTKGEIGKQRARKKWQGQEKERKRPKYIKTIQHGQTDTVI